MWIKLIWWKPIQLIFQIQDLRCNLMFYYTIMIVQKTKHDIIIFHWMPQPQNIKDCTLYIH